MVCWKSQKLSAFNFDPKGGLKGIKGVPGLYEKYLSPTICLQRVHFLENDLIQGTTPVEVAKNICFGKQAKWAYLTMFNYLNTKQTAIFYQFKFSQSLQININQLLMIKFSSPFFFLQIVVKPLLLIDNFDIDFISFTDADPFYTK